MLLNRVRPERAMPCEEGLAQVNPKRSSEAIPADRLQTEFTQRRILCVDDNVLELTLRGKILELQGLLSGSRCGGAPTLRQIALKHYAK